MTSQNTEENKLIAERRTKLEQIRKQCASNGFPNDFRREHYAQDVQDAYAQFDKEELIEKIK